MKKTFLLFTFLAGFAVVNAQTTAEFGLKGGVNIATFSDNISTNFKSKAGFHAGALVHIHLSRYFAIQPEAMFSSQGAKLNVGNAEYKYDVNYVNIPLLLQFMAGQGFRVETGPQLGILASAKVKSGGLSVENKNSYQSTDFSWAVGLGYLSSSNLGVDVRYNLGVSDIGKSNNSKTVNNVLQLGLFYQFR